MGTVPARENSGTYCADPIIARTLFTIALANPQFGTKLIRRGSLTTALRITPGDFLLWFGYPDLFSGPEAIECYDLWQMRDGYHVTTTYRLEDLPRWFRLHPTEVCDTFVYRMMVKVEKGDYPSEPMDGPNLWRLKSGDRVAWVGAERPERPSVNQRSGAWMKMRVNLSQEFIIGGIGGSTFDAVILGHWWTGSWCTSHGRGAGSRQRCARNYCAR